MNGEEKTWANLGIDQNSREPNTRGDIFIRHEVKGKISKGKSRRHISQRSIRSHTHTHNTHIYIVDPAFGIAYINPRPNKDTCQREKRGIYNSIKQSQTEISELTMAHLHIDASQSWEEADQNISSSVGRNLPADWI
jgi:hypothetical protein